jgi:hypothetical protein
VSYKIYRKKYLPVGKTSQILPLSELFVFTITAFKIFSIFIMFVGRYKKRVFLEEKSFHYAN